MFYSIGAFGSRQTDCTMSPYAALRRLSNTAQENITISTLAEIFLLSV